MSCRLSIYTYSLKGRDIAHSIIGDGLTVVGCKHVTPKRIFIRIGMSFGGGKPLQLTHTHPGS